MARMPRFNVPGVAQHVIQRGNNRQVCFACEGDMAAYAAWLKEYADKFGVAVHAWVFMTNHVHLLMTPNETGDGVSKLMQALGRRYVQYFNYQYKRSGTLWEGRFKSCLVQDEHYLLLCYRYIELNPVRAGMVATPGEYVWSSYQCNAEGKPMQLCTPHAQYLALDPNDEVRQDVYKKLFLGHIDSSQIHQVRKTTNQGMALGNEGFQIEIERLTKRRSRPLNPGRPRKKCI